MTLERSYSQTTFDSNNEIITTLLTERPYRTVPNTPVTSSPKTPRKFSRGSFNYHTPLSKTQSDHTILSGTSGISRNTWISTESVDGSLFKKREVKPIPKISARRQLSLQHSSSSSQNFVPRNGRRSSFPHAFRQDSRLSNCSSVFESVSQNSKEITNSLKNNSSSQSFERSSRTSTEKLPASLTSSRRASREVLLEFPPMPRSNNAQTLAAKKCEKNREKKSGLKPAQSMPGLAEQTNKESRSHSADARPRQSTTCALFLIFRRKKKSKENRSPSPDDRKPEPSRAAQSTPRSDRLSVSSNKDRRPSQASSTNRERQPSNSSSRLLQTPSSSRAPPSPHSTNTERTPKYESRSRQRHRKDKPEKKDKHERGHTSGSRSHSDHRPIRHEDLPPHPSILKSSVEKTKSDPTTAKANRKKQVLRNDFSFRSRSKSKEPEPDSKVKSTPKSDTVRLEPTYKSETPVEDQTVKLDVTSKSDSLLLEKTPKTRSSSRADSAQPELISKPRSESKSDSASHRKASATNSGSTPASKSGGSASNLKAKSLISTSKTDPETESQYQPTISSTDRQSFRSQSLPRFDGHCFRPDADTKVISDAEDFEYQPTDMISPLNLSLCGCGFLGMYHLGVVSCLIHRAPSFLEKVEKVGGSSAGALMAAVLVTSKDKIEESADHVQNLAKEIRRKPLGALTPGFSFTRSLRTMLEDILPEDAHETASGKLYVSLTNAQTKKNELMTDFKSKDELIEALVASCYIPVYAGMKTPTIRGKYMDGGMSDNMPKFESGRTITVSPFDGKSDIGPKMGQEVEKKAHFINFHNQDLQVNMNNLKKGKDAFFPPQSHILQEYFEKGRYDASRFLIREGLYEINTQQQSQQVLYESSV
ncbi:mucin-2-like isoform X2 [Physella acuta]|uniref:mucin-2-like isoform X2 n=1 Tax=Physella acuta TaxID=109671 RepID=UPI0027DD9F3A|nr:mucin-2-like isoform X2 [Physella acuta]